MIFQKRPFAKKNVILGNFKDGDEYRKFAEEELISMKEKKEMEKLLIE